jgi:hypothetical protein
MLSKRVVALRTSPTGNRTWGLDRCLILPTVPLPTALDGEGEDPVGLTQCETLHLNINRSVFLGKMFALRVRQFMIFTRLFPTIDFIFKSWQILFACRICNMREFWCCVPDCYVPSDERGCPNVGQARMNSFTAYTMSSFTFFTVFMTVGEYKFC